MLSSQISGQRLDDEAICRFDGVYDFLPACSPAFILQLYKVLMR